MPRHNAGRPAGRRPPGGAARTVLLLEDDLAAIHRGVALDTRESVRLAGHELAGNLLGFGDALLVGGGLDDVELLGLKAELVELVVLSPEVDRARGPRALWALVGEASALDLVVGEGVVLRLGERLGVLRGHGGREHGGQGSGGRGFDHASHAGLHRLVAKGSARRAGLQRVRGREQSESKSKDAHHRQAAGSTEDERSRL